LIGALRRLGCEVILAALGDQADLLAAEFPGIRILPLQGYGIRYASGAAGFGLRMLLQLPRIRRAVDRERRWLRKTAAAERIDAVISDNRLGLHHSRIPCVILTHQLLIKSPFGPRSEKWLQRVNYHYIKKFSACWVVDYAGPENLAGALSHPATPPRVPVHYLGALSRFQKKGDAVSSAGLLVLISGPEPQRTLFEELVVGQAVKLDTETLIITGRPSVPRDEMLTGRVRIVNHLPSAALGLAMQQSRRILCRSGYSSVMDLVRLGAKAILVPTPGQTEQQYLADRLMRKGYFLSVAQEHFDLKEALRRSETFPFVPFPYREPCLGVLEEFVEGL
jgi:UDP-N-acetylglucosamine transferase subunit ALG13